MKVLHIITRLDPGGSSTNTIETVSRLDKAHFEVFLISGRTHDPDGRIEALLQARHISYQFFPRLQRSINPINDFIVFIELYQFMKKNHFDIVHTHTSKAGILGRWAARLAAVPVIIHTPHGHVFYGYFGKIMTQLFIWIERLTARITTKIITLTDRGKQEHVDFKIGPFDQFVTIYSGIEFNSNKVPCDAASKAGLRQKFGIPEGAFLFGTVARLEPIKGINYLVEALSFVLKAHPQAHLLLVGDGSETERLKSQCAHLGITTQVTFAGFHEKPTDLMELMDVFVLPSVNEGMGRVILEAMALAKPVIGTKVGGVPELITEGRNGLLVPSCDAKALSVAMLTMITNPSMCQQMGEEGKRTVSHRFTLEKMVKDIEELYIKTYAH